MEFRVCLLAPILLCALSLTSATPTVLSNYLTAPNGSTSGDEQTTGSSMDLFSLANITDKLLGLHHVQHHTAHHDHTLTVPSTNTTGLPGSDDVGDLSNVLRLATIPADVLNLVRMLAVPVIDASLGLPATLLEQISNTTLPGMNAESLMASLTVLQGNASRWLHSNGSSSHTGSGAGNISFPRMPLRFPLFQADANSTSSPLDASNQHGSLFNSTRAGARTAALLGERIFLTPMSALLSLAVSNGHRGSSSLPETLNPDHLQRHLAHLTRFLGAAQSSSTAAPTTDAGSGATTITP